MVLHKRLHFLMLFFIRFLLAKLTGFSFIESSKHKSDRFIYLVIWKRFIGSNNDFCSSILLLLKNSLKVDFLSRKKINRF